MLDHEPGGEVSIECLSDHIAHLKARGRTARDGGKHLLGIKPCGTRIGKCLTGTCKRPCNGDLIRCLGLLSRARSTLIDDVFAHRSKEGLHGVGCVLVAADQNVQCGVSRSHISSRDRSIEGMDTAFFCLLIDADGERGGGGCHIGDVCTGG